MCFYKTELDSYDFVTHRLLCFCQTSDYK